MLFRTLSPTLPYIATDITVYPQATANKAVKGSAESRYILPLYCW